MTLQHAPRKGSFFSLHFLLFRFRRRRRSLPWLLLLLLLPLLLLPLLLLSLEDEDDESESDDDDDDDDDEEEDEDKPFALLSLSFSCSFFKCSRMRSVNPPNPMLVKKLMENRTFFKGAFGMTPVKYSCMSSSDIFSFNFFNPNCSLNS